MAGCSSKPLPVAGLATAPSVAPTLPPSTLDKPTSVSTHTSIPLFLRTPVPPTPFVATSFAEFPGNLATGEAAKDFTVNLLGGGQFSLSDQGENYLLVFPTIISCGDCVFGITQISIANEAFLDSGLKILILDLWIDDDVSNWDYFADLVNQPNFLWGVVTSESYAIDYNVLGLGTIFLIDPAQQIVFRSDHPLPAWQLEELFTLATNSFWKD